MTPQEKLKFCYIAFAICVVTCCIPQMSIQTFAMIFSLVIIIAFYVVRGKWQKESPEYIEATQLIKTFWVWSLIYVVGIFVAGGVISSFGDMTVINEWTESVVQGGAVPDEEGMKRMTEQYMATNLNLIISATLACVLPSLIYAFLRTKSAMNRLKNPPAPPLETIIS